ncbi:MAG: response regulator transcription factor [Pygmaiobacter massiliensis]|nr:response regulator transcription factor [Pygmaiobacter massiliensis]
MIFCVEDDNAIRELEVYTLKTAGYEAQGFSDGASFFEALASQTPQLVLLDVMLPGEDGIEILRKLRAETATCSLPVILATAKGTEYDKVNGLDQGADDYIVKPFGMMELISRVRALLRRAAPPQDVLRSGDLVIDTGRHQIFADGREVTLTRKEFELLRLLASHPGRVFTRDALLSEVWGYDFDGETRTIDVHLRTLRQKLGATGARVETVRGVGYRLKE